MPTTSQAPVAPAQHGGSFINKPARGWLHPDAQIARDGIAYVIRYIGSLEVHTSMKSLDFDTRSQIAKECINRVCEAAGLKTLDKKRKVERRISRILGETPRMVHAGTDVQLTITSSCLRLTALDSGLLVASHDMPNISFASGGDPDTLDFVAYVAKDNVQGRTCLVLECGGGLAQDVITTIGQAFELRFKEYLKRTPGSGAGTSAGPPPVVGRPVPVPDPSAITDPDYYNDLPGKVPPDLAPPVPPLPQYHPLADNTNNNPKQLNNKNQQIQFQSQQRPLPVHPTQLQRPATRHGLALDDNLIDLNAEVSNPPVGRGPDHDYVNGHVTIGAKDPFDMHPFSSGLPSPLLPPANPGSGSAFTPLTAGASGRGLTSVHQALLLQEPWYHGAISRKDAESRLQAEGDFLVRESQGSPGQYVLTGLQGGQFKHLLLVDPEGVVRTKDLTFDSVSHLIHYHRTNALPIISAESALLLRRPVQRP
nr:EOG090X098F [Lepidurus arcticus]